MCTSISLSGMSLKTVTCKDNQPLGKKRAHQLTHYLTLQPAFYLASYATYVAFYLSYILTCYLALYLELCLPVYIRIWHFICFILFLYLPFWAILTYFLTCSLTFQFSGILTWYLAIWWYLFQLICHTYSHEGTLAFWPLFFEPSPRPMWTSLWLRTVMVMFTGLPARASSGQTVNHGEPNYQ